MEGENMTEKIFEFPFEKLEVWHLAVDFDDFILNIVESFPQNKYLRLIGQMEAAVSSISQNIAEGKGRQYKKEFIQFLYVAEGSLFEVLTLTEIFKRRKLVKEDEFIEIRKQAELIDRKLHGLINSLRSRSN
jgi:four helix bundle protein